MRVVGSMEIQPMVRIIPANRVASGFILICSFDYINNSIRIIRYIYFALLGNGYTSRSSKAGLSFKQRETGSEEAGQEIFGPDRYAIFEFDALNFESDGFAAVPRAVPGYQSVPGIIGRNICAFRKEPETDRRHMSVQFQDRRLGSFSPFFFCIARRVFTTLVYFPFAVGEGISIVSVFDDMIHFFRRPFVSLTITTIIDSP